MSNNIGGGPIVLEAGSATVFAILFSLVDGTVRSWCWLQDDNDVEQITAPPDVGVLVLPVEQFSQDISKIQELVNEHSYLWQQ